MVEVVTSKSFTTLRKLQVDWYAPQHFSKSKDMKAVVFMGEDRKKFVALSTALVSDYVNLYVEKSIEIIFYFLTDRECDYFITAYNKLGSQYPLQILGSEFKYYAPKAEIKENVIYSRNFVDDITQVEMKVTWGCNDIIQTYLG